MGLFFLEGKKDGMKGGREGRRKEKETRELSAQSVLLFQRLQQSLASQLLSQQNTKVSLSRCVIAHSRVQQLLR